MEGFSVKKGTRRQSICKACQKNRYSSMYHKAHNLKKRYGISLLDYEKMLQQQEGRCAICKAEPGARSLAVDHCSNTGYVRGLLCMSCNQAIGAFDHNPVLLKLAAEYLQRAIAEQESTKASIKALLEVLRK